MAARYRIARLGVYDQRIENLVLGDPRAPDLTARWVELHLGIGSRGPYVTRVRAGGVRLRGRLADGRVTLGSVDRLLPTPTGAPFTLPDLDVDLSDARMRLETGAGTIGLALDGSGMLADGFHGRLAAASGALDIAGCQSERGRASLEIAIVKRRPKIDGVVQADRVRCGTVFAEAPRAPVKVRLSPQLDRWAGQAALELASTTAPAGRLERIRGQVDFAGTAGGTTGRLDLH
ncbi:MAG: hypothetical protein EOP59_12350, partial [Sphingomonadales bacterium]